MTGSGYSYVVSVFPEVELISDEALREKVANTWLSLLESSEYDRIEDCPYTLDPAIDINLVEHVQATTRAVIAVADVLQEVHEIHLDRDRLLSAILLHDASKLLEWSSVDGRIVKSDLGELFPHSYLAGHFALQHGIDPIIAHLIISHTNLMHQLPRFPEGVVIHYVDMVCADIVRAVRDLPLHLNY